MDDGPGKIKVIRDDFQAPTSSVESLENRTPSISEPRTDKSLRSSFQLWTRRKLRAPFMLNLFTLRGLPWGSRTGCQEKVELTAAEIESLRSELTDIEERAAHLKAQLEYIDEVLRSARLSGYLYIRTRWTALPGEPPPIDDTDVNDWLPRFVVLHGACIFLYLLCTDLSPQDSTLLSDIVEVGRLPSIKYEDDETRYAFYILTRQGLRWSLGYQLYKPTANLSLIHQFPMVQLRCNIIYKSFGFVPLKNDFPQVQTNQEDKKL